MSIEFTKKILKLTIELDQTSDYWSEYDVPIGIKERILDAKTDCLNEIKAEIASLEKQADFLAFHSGTRKDSKMMEQSYAIREEAGLLEQWLDGVLYE